MLNEPALRECLRRHLPDASGPIAIEPLGGGQSNPTFRLRWGLHSYVLRKQPEGVLLPSAHAVDREYRVITARDEARVRGKRARRLRTAVSEHPESGLAGSRECIGPPPRPFRAEATKMRRRGLDNSKTTGHIVRMARRNVREQLLSAGVDTPHPNGVDTTRA